jgi:peptidoglycan/LPS O-acetylase OafA/YrhL
MGNKGVLTKVLAVAGTVLVWFPILAPILFSTILFIQRQIFRFDYLMPAELGLFAFGGGIILLVAAIRARSYGKVIGWGLGIALITVVGGQMIAVVTGLADGSTEPSGWQWALVLGALAIYILAVIGVGVGGILLLRDVFRSQKTIGMTQ